MKHAIRSISLAAVSALVLSTATLAQSDPPPAQVPPLPPVLPEGIPAFPGAWGGGMFATGGRGGRVIEVTNLDDAGPGSFRHAVEQAGKRIVVFRVAGLIQLQSNVDIDHPDITIAGQTAPGDGVCLANHSLNINTSNVILRHLRVRRGRPQGGQGSDNIGGNPVGQVIVDHCSASWGMDENLSLYRHMKPEPDGSRSKQPVRNLTVQYCISSEALNAGNHAFGGTWGGEDATFHHNLFACNTARNPSIGMSGEFDYRNNVVFNWGHRSMDGGDETSLVNVIANYYKAGPATRDDMRSTIARVEARNQYSPSGRFKESDWFPQADRRPGKWYVAGNVVEGDEKATADNWAGMRWAGETDGSVEVARVNSPFEAWPVRQQSARAAYEAVLAGAGATLPKRDAVDARVIEMVRTGKVGGGNGIIKSPDEVGGYPKYAFDPKSVPPDGDHDGMPDAWEKKHKLNPADPADGPADADKDGYTNVEECLNGTDPTRAVDYRDLDNNVDTISAADAPAARPAAE